MYQATLLKLHRWTTLIFAVPLLVIIVTGLILSVQPILQHASIAPGSLTADRLLAYLQQYDPAGAARNLSIDPYERRMTLGTPGGPVEIDLDTGRRAETPASPLARLFQESRRIHERLLFGLSPLVPISTGAMLLLALLGVLMGLPKFRNSLSGWHKGVAWVMLPLVVVSPLTGLALTFGISMTSPPPRGAALPLADTIRAVAAVTDPSNLLLVGVRGGRPLVRTMENGEMRAYAATPDGLRPMERNWPRLVHEGNWRGIWSGLVNVLTSLALIALLGTGLLIWARRTFRRRSRRRLPLRASTPSP